MADSIATIPATVTSVDTAEHELSIPANLQPSGGELVVSIEVLTGTIQLSVGKSISGGSSTFTNGTNQKVVLTIPPGQNIFYKATTTGDKFTIAR